MKKIQILFDLTNSNLVQVDSAKIKINFKFPEESSSSVQCHSKRIQVHTRQIQVQIWKNSSLVHLID